MRERINTTYEKEPIRFTSSFIEEKKPSRLEYEPSQDCVIVDDNNGIYGVFDGLGAGGGRPELAAMAARNATLLALQEARPPASFDEMLGTMHAVFKGAREAVIERGEGGSTTATVAWHVTLNDEDFWVLGNAGDSRSYLYDPTDKSFAPITTNQGRGRVVTNCFESSPYGRNGRSDEFRIIPFQRSMRLMLCTDGITGDLPAEALTDWQFRDAFSRRDPSEAAQAFYEYSKKIDDKSIIIVDAR